MVIEDMSSDPTELKPVPVEEGTPPKREVEWTPENEVNLFYALRGHRPIGVQRYFQMYFIVEKFSELMKKEIASQELWDHLEEMYDLDSLNSQDPLYQNPEKVDFDLPSELKKFKSKTNSNTKPPKAKSAVKSKESKES